MRQLTSFILGVRVFTAFAGNGMQSLLADRAMVIADFFIGTGVPYLVQFFIWSHIYQNGDQVIAGFTERQTIFYYAFALAFGRLNNGYEVIERLSFFIQEGRLEAYLTRPLAYPWQRFWEFMGESVLYLIPLGVVAFVWWMSAPSHSFGLVYPLAAITLILASQLLCFQLSFLIACLAFWVVRSDILLSLVISLAALFGGLLLPPDFWPEWLSPVMKYNPFRYMIAGPAEFLVKPSGAFWVECLIFSLSYSFIAYTLMRFLWNRGLSHYNGAGG